MYEEKAWDVGFVCRVSASDWYDKFRDAKLPFGVSYLIFQLEHCTATGAFCVRGYAQSKTPKSLPLWRTRLEIDEASVLKARPGAAAHMAESCMVDGVDIDGKFWLVEKPYVVKGRIRIPCMEKICMDIEDGVPLTTIAERYPKQWNYCRGSLQSYERIVRGCETPADWLCGKVGGMHEIVYAALVHRKHADAIKRKRDSEEEFIKTTLV